MRQQSVFSKYSIHIFITEKWMILSEVYLLVRSSRVCFSFERLFLGVISAFVVHPLDTLKVMMQYQSTHSISQAAKLIVQLNSVRLYAKQFVRFKKIFCFRSRSKDFIVVFHRNYYFNVHLKHHFIVHMEVVFDF